MFRDRTDAGEQLARAIKDRALIDPVVLALPRGGVPVAIPVAHAIAAPLDLLLVRKIGAPGNKELAVGAVVDGPGHNIVFNDHVLEMLGLAPADFNAQIAGKLSEIEARRQLWLAGRPPTPVTGRSVVVVDDGIATGATVKAALKGLASKGAAEIVLAVPVAPSDTLEKMRPLVDDIVCLSTPAPFYAVGVHYAQFDQVADADVAALLSQFRNQNT